MHEVGRHQRAFRRRLVQENLVGTDAAALFDRPLARAASAGRIEAVADADETTTDQSLLVARCRRSLADFRFGWRRSGAQFRYRCGILAGNRLVVWLEGFGRALWLPRWSNPELRASSQQYEQKTGARANAIAAMRNLSGRSRAHRAIVAPHAAIRTRPNRQSDNVISAPYR